MTENEPKKRSPIIPGEYISLPVRALTEETCEKFRYQVGEYKGKECHIANYCDELGKVVAQKLRFADKTFVWTGEPKKAGLYGQQLWRDGGKMIVVTEGELDALSMSQLQDNKWPVVSIPNGAQSAAKEIGKNLEWLEKFESVVFMFDNDEAGIDAARECAQVLSPGRAKIASLPLKDANEMLVAGRGAEVISAMWGAKVWRPDEIVAGTDLWPVITAENTHVQIPYPWQGLNRSLFGLRQREITTICAGSGIGKSTACGELTHWILAQNQTIGYIALEESTKHSALRILSVEVNQRLHTIPQDKWDKDKLRKAFEKTVGSGRWYTYDHFGSMDADNLFSRIRYMVTGLGCQWIVLDHVSIVVSGMEEGDERRLIDNLMTKLRSLVENLGFGLILVSHLKDTDGKSLEEGGQTHLNLLRGSRSIGQLSDIVLGLERNQQDPENKNLCAVRILKDRFGGETGVHANLLYDRETGRLQETILANEFGLKDETQEPPPESSNDTSLPKGGKKARKAF